MLVKSEFCEIETIIRRRDILLLKIKDVKLNIEVEVKAEHSRKKLDLKTGDKVFITGHLRNGRDGKHKIIATYVEKIEKNV